MRNSHQVEIAERYDHKHQALSAEDPSRGLNRMARDVVKHLLRTLAAAGVALGIVVTLKLAQRVLTRRLNKLALRTATDIDDLAADFPKLKILMAHPGWPWVDEATAVALH